MFGFFTWVANAVQGIVTWLFTLVLNVFSALWSLVTDLPCWVLEQVMQLATSLANSVPGDLSQFSLAQYIGALPPQVLNVMGLLHVGTCSAMIVAALIIRFIIQTVPFVRWGS